MTTNFQIKAVSKNRFDDFTQLNEVELERKFAKWITVDVNPGYPCRVSLIDAIVGERVLALPFRHHNVESPYRASGPIFVREHAKTAKLEVNEIPEMLRQRLLSVRAYDTTRFMIGAEVVQGVELALAIERQFLNSEVEYIHLHNANPGCFNCSVYRA
ncbi:MAG: DUF1203 domain-containing protein [Pseudomonadales bacterium]